MLDFCLSDLKYVAHEGGKQEAYSALFEEMHWKSCRASAIRTPPIPHSWGWGRGHQGRSLLKRENRGIWCHNSLTQCCETFLY